MNVHDRLRDWAHGSAPREAATELLIHTGLANNGDPWVLTDRAWQTQAIDYDTVAEWADVFPAPDHHILTIAASLANGTPINLRDTIPGLTRHPTQLVMTAIAHAAGYTHHTTEITTTDGIPQILPASPLATWPDQPETP